MKIEFFGAGLALSAVIFLGAGCTKHPYDVGQAPPRQNFPFASTTPTIDTANWKTYTNSDVGLTFKYPTNWPAPRLADPATIAIGEDGLMGMISITDITEFANEYRDCLAKKDEETCQKSYGRNLAEFQAHIEFVSGKNANQANYNVGCGAIGGDPLSLSKISDTITRTVYFCGYDASIDNYAYYAPTIINNKLIELHLPLFPRDSDIYTWAHNTSGGDMVTHFKTFSQNLDTSLKNQKPDVRIAQELAEYDTMAVSIRAL